MNSNLLRKYISGDVTREELFEVSEWLNANESNMREFLAFRKLYDIAVWNEKAPDKKEVVKTRHWSIRLTLEVLKVAAVFLIAFKLVDYYTLPPQEEEVFMQTLHVPAGQRAEITLTDGSKVWLNAMSSLTFPNVFKDNKRQVKLEGEGYFEIQSDPERPFIINTPEHEVKALGTTLNVLSYPNSSLFETSLLEGKIEVRQYGSNSTYTLRPNTRIYKENGKLKVSHIPDFDYFLWTDGLICIDDENIPSLLNKLQLYYDVRIDILNQDILNIDYHYTGKFRIKDGIEHVLKVLRFNIPFRYERNDEENVITIK